MVKQKSDLKALENWEKKSVDIAAGKNVVEKKAKTFSLPVDVIDKLRVHSAVIKKEQSEIMRELLEAYFAEKGI
jgi:hypothetical protein